MNTHPEITIRPAYADDELALRRLAVLDSADAVPPVPLLLAELDGQLRVALSLADGSAIADPFVRTAGALELLRLRARAEAATQPRRARRRRFRALRAPSRPRAQVTHP
ncbi:MAG TPA: hypothetical protein VG410_15595 [Solirubrobacteraceae bacterium]|jgi:hypothetical protein|nr:hypothetical protein [Solirubrobacteraceae bacterium]